MVLRNHQHSQTVIGESDQIQVSRNISSWFVIPNLLPECFPIVGSIQLVSQRKNCAW